MALQGATPNATTCAIQGLESPLVGALVSLAVLFRAAPTGFASPAPLRSLLTVSHGKDWPVTAPTTTLPLGTLVSLGALFDHLVVETGKLPILLARGRSPGLSLRTRGQRFWPRWSGLCRGRRCAC
jgi:hypothetical protein